MREDVGRRDGWKERGDVKAIFRCYECASLTCVYLPQHDSSISSNLRGRAAGRDESGE